VGSAREPSARPPRRGTDWRGRLAVALPGRDSSRRHAGGYAFGAPRPIMMAALVATGGP
jgi:hypothetical protein